MNELIGLLSLVIVGIVAIVALFVIGRERKRDSVPPDPGEPVQAVQPAERRADEFPRIRSG